MDYNPTADYGSAWEAVQRRIKAGFAGQRGREQQDLAARNVATSGVSQIPLEDIDRNEGAALSDQAGQFALDQAHTGIEDRRAAEDFARQKELAQFGYDRQEAIARRMGQNGLQAGLIGGGLSAIGSILSRK